MVETEMYSYSRQTPGRGRASGVAAAANAAVNAVCVWGMRVGLTAVFYSLQSTSIANQQHSLISYSINHLPASLGFYVTIL